LTIRQLLFRTLAFWILVPSLLTPAYAANSFPSLRDSRSPALQQGLERALANLSLAGPSRSHRLAVALVDVTDPHHPRMAAVNGDRMMYAASLPKIAILLGAFQRIADGSLTLDKSTRATLTAMIRHSNNHAATKMLHEVGMNYLAKLLQSPRYDLYDPRYDGGLWVGKAYSSASARKPDPLHHLSHGATALQVARYYYLLETGRLVSPRASAQMKTILGNSAIHHKFVKGLERNRPGSTIYRKSGTWRTWHADSAIVERDGHRYIAVALADDPHGSQWLPRLIVAMDDLIFRPTATQVAGLGDTTR
jgi:beta-lactamase class A